MDTTPDRLLNQLVVAALTIFLLVLMLLGALVVRQVGLQQDVADLRDDVQMQLEELEVTTDEIQDNLQDLQAGPIQGQDAEDWEAVSETLEEVDEQLGALGERLEEVTSVLDVSPEATSNEFGGDEATAVQDSVDQVFTIFAALVALASIAVALLLGLAIRVQQRVAARAQRIETR